MGKKSDSDREEGCSSEEEERKRKKLLKKKQDRERGEKRIQEYNRHWRSVDTREDDCLKGRRGVVIEYQSNKEEETSERIREKRVNERIKEINGLEKRMQKMEETLNEIWKFMNRSSMYIREAEESKEARENIRYRREEGKKNKFQNDGYETNSWFEIHGLECKKMEQ